MCRRRCMWFRLCKSGFKLRLKEWEMFKLVEKGWPSKANTSKGTNCEHTCSWIIRQKKKRKNPTLYSSQFTSNCLKPAYGVFTLRAMQQPLPNIFHVQIIFHPWTLTPHHQPLLGVGRFFKIISKWLYSPWMILSGLQTSFLLKEFY